MKFNNLLEISLFREIKKLYLKKHYGNISIEN